MTSTAEGTTVEGKCRRPPTTRLPEVVWLLVGALLFLALINSLDWRSMMVGGGRILRAQHMLASKRLSTLDDQKHFRDILQVQNELYKNVSSEHWVLVLADSSPNEQVVALASLETHTTLVVEMAKEEGSWLSEFHTLWEGKRDGNNTEPSLVFLNRRMQTQLPLLAAQKDDDRSRRNVGILYAILCGAKYIYEAHTDGEGVLGVLPTLLLENGGFPQAKGDNTTWLVNPYAIYGRPDIWPKGFPIGAVKAATFEYRKVLMPMNSSSEHPFLQWSLTDDHPQMDAVLRLSKEAHGGPRSFYSQPPGITIHKGYFAPTGYGGHIFKSQAFWGMPLFEMRSKVLSHTWRSLWVQRLLWTVQGQLLIAPATAKASRADDAKELYSVIQEVEVHKDTLAMVEFLHRWKAIKADLPGLILALIRDLAGHGFIALEEIEFMSAWLADLQAVGYTFPEVSNTASSRGESTKILAAFCFSGEADRSPIAIPSTIRQMEALMVAPPHSEEAAELAADVEHKMDSDGNIVFAHHTFAYVSTHGSCPSHVQWLSQQPFTYSTMYNDPQLEIPYTLDAERFGGNPVVPMLYQMHGLQRCYETVMEYAEEQNVEYQLIVRARTDHEILNLAPEHSAFCLWTRKSLSEVTIPKPSYDWSNVIPDTGGYQDRLGWGPPRYMKAYMSRWSQFFNKSHVDSNPPYHGESSLKYALNNVGAPVGRIPDDELRYDEIPHDEKKCERQTPVDMSVTIT